MELRRLQHKTAGIILTKVIQKTDTHIICSMPYYLDSDRISRQDWLPFRAKDILENQEMNKTDQMIYLNKKMQEYDKVFS